jgi:hypothetical protein
VQIRRKLRRWFTGYDEQGVNIRLLWKVERQIRRHPEQYDQHHWVQHPSLPESYGDGPTAPEMIDPLVKPGNGPVCGTQACVAGHAVMISHRWHDFIAPWDDDDTRPTVNWQLGGETVLGLNHDLAVVLFSGERKAQVMPDLLRAIRLGEVRDYADLHATEHRLMHEWWQQQSSAEELVDEPF